MKTQHLYLLAGGVVAAALVWAVTRASSTSASSAGQYIGGAVIDLADGVVSGVVTGVGETVFGIPKTNLTKCEQAKAEGRTWDASFDCPAGDFIKYLWN